MTKIKKIVAAAVAAVALSTAGITAFAGMDYALPAHYFHFDIGDEVIEISGTGYSDLTKKTRAGDAWGLVEEGSVPPTEGFPLSLCVTKGKGNLPVNRVTETVEFYTVGPSYEKRLPYLYGQGVVGNYYYLCGTCGEYNLKVSGVWCP